MIYNSLTFNKRGIMKKLILSINVVLILIFWATSLNAKTFVVAESIEPSTFDPIKSSGLGWHSQVWSTVLETLAWTDPSGNVHPRLATSWSTSSDGLVWNFKLRKNVRFHNNEVLTADDVVYSFERAMSDGIPMVKQRYKNVKSLSAVNDHSVKINLKNKDNLFINTVGDPTGIAFSILNRKDGNNNRHAIAPIGTGPVIFESYSPNNKLNLVVNKNYWDKSVLPSWDELVVRWITEDASQVAALNTGEVDVIQPSSIATSKSLSKKSNYGKKSYPATSFFISVSRVGKTRHDSIPIAIMKSIDRDALSKIAFLGEAVPYSTAHPLITYSLPISKLPNYKRDIPGCKKHLSKAGHKNGIQLEFLYPKRNPFEDIIFETIQDSLSDCGIDLKLAPVEPAVWLKKFLKAKYDLSATDQGWYSNPVRYVLPRVGWQAPVEEIVPSLPSLISKFSSVSFNDRPKVFNDIQILESQTGYPFIGTVWVNRSVFWNKSKVRDIDISTLVTKNRRDFYLSIK